jgi:hypothetical protein
MKRVVMATKLEQFYLWLWLLKPPQKLLELG